MYAILLSILVAGAPSTPAYSSRNFAQADAAAARLLPNLATGSLIFSQGDCLAVKVYTASRLTHVASVLVKDGAATVYDSTAGHGVRKMPLSEFLAGQGDADLAVYAPTYELSTSQAAAFERHLESQLGRPYAIAHHVTGNRCAGLHCAEYAVDALSAAQIIGVEHPARQSPATLREAIVHDALYARVAVVQIEPEPEVPPADASWCTRLWFSARQSGRAGYRKLWAWFCCK